MKASGLGELRDDHDANNTYEGDNNVLQMQTSNYLVKQFQDAMEARKNGARSDSGFEDDQPHDGVIQSQLKSIDLLNEAEKNLKLNFGEKTIDNVLSMTFILEAYRFLVSYLMFRSLDKLDVELKIANKDLFVARSNSQVKFRYCLIYFF